MAAVLNLILMMFVAIIILLIVVIAQRTRDGSYIATLKKSILIKKLEITERALTKDLDSNGIPSIDELVRAGQLVEMPPDQQSKEVKDKVENKIGFK